MKFSVLGIVFNIAFPDAGAFIFQSERNGMFSRIYGGRFSQYTYKTFVVFVISVYRRSVNLSVIREFGIGNRRRLHNGFFDFPSTDYILCSSGCPNTGFFVPKGKNNAVFFGKSGGGGSSLNNIFIVVIRYIGGMFFSVKRKFRICQNGRRYLYFFGRSAGNYLPAKIYGFIRIISPQICDVVVFLKGYGYDIPVRV